MSRKAELMYSRTLIKLTSYNYVLFVTVSFLGNLFGLCILLEHSSISEPDHGCANCITAYVFADSLHRVFDYSSVRTQLWKESPPSSC